VLRHELLTSPPGQSVETVRRGLAARFRAAGIDSFELDARLLMGAALTLDLTGLVRSATRCLTQQEVDRLEGFARRRLKGEPVARILGEREFWSINLRLSPETLVPRPDTETVVELALEMLGSTSVSSPLRILDIGSGSGAILLALLSERPQAFGVGTDISEGALRTARRNACELRLLPRAAFVACNYAAAFNGGFDLIVSNPPYIRSADIAGLAREVRVHEPQRALDGGADGLSAYRALIPQAVGLLEMGGALVLEVGCGRSDEVEALMTAAGLTLEESRADLAGIRRAVGGRKRPR
jgi:release factor glutamine methyltransferase